MTRDKRWQAKFSGFVSRWKQFLSLKNCRSVRICSVLNRSNRDTTVYYRLIFCAFSWPNMVKWHHSGIIHGIIFLPATGMKCSYGKIFSPLTEIPVGKTEISVTEPARPLILTHQSFTKDLEVRWDLGTGPARSTGLIWRGPKSIAAKSIHEAHVWIL